MIQLNRKIQISRLAEFVANEFSDGNITLLHEIANDEGVAYYFDSYEDAFDGMLLYDNSDFHIHINIDKGNRRDSKRGRFTFAHELGHFFIDEHRLGLKYGFLEPHASFHNFNQKSLIEDEANYFASCLLMPQEKFRKQAGGKKFSFDTIHNLSDSFQSSISSTLIRFSEIGTHEIFSVISKDNIVQWFVRSNDFPKWPLKFKKGGIIPSTTLASEYFMLGNRKYENAQKLHVDDWFIPPEYDNRAERPMYEQCFYSEDFGYVTSLLWFD